MLSTTTRVLSAPYPGCPAPPSHPKNPCCRLAPVYGAALAAPQACNGTTTMCPASSSCCSAQYSPTKQGTALNADRVERDCHEIPPATLAACRPPITQANKRRPPPRAQAGFWRHLTPPLSRDLLPVAFAGCMLNGACCLPGPPNPPSATLPNACVPCQCESKAGRQATLYLGHASRPGQHLT